MKTGMRARREKSVSAQKRAVEPESNRVRGAKKQKETTRNGSQEKGSQVWRFRLIQTFMLIAVLLVSGRVAYLQIEDRSFLEGQGDLRTLRNVSLPASRGIVVDRNGRPLAVSTRVVDIIANPQIAIDSRDHWPELSKALNISYGTLKRKLEGGFEEGLRFIYLQRRMKPGAAKKVLALKVGGIHGRPAYKRYYPAGEVTSQLVGLTNIDDQGQEGVELAMDRALAGEPGVMQVVKDRRGRVVRSANVKASAEPGKDVPLSIDLSLQYLAYRELLKTVQDNKAESASLVMLDARTGEVLAMVNQPSFNPNNRAEMNLSGMRNRAITDLFEPGSTIKPFTIAAGLESGRYDIHTKINVVPYRIGSYWVRDARNHGTLDVTQVLVRSSNVGVSKIALDIGSEPLVNMLQRVGIGQSTGVRFPGENIGTLPMWPRLRDRGVASLSYGYGLTVSTLQLAKAYLVLANDGKYLPVSIYKQDMPSEGRQVIAPGIAQKVLSMMKMVVSNKGTARRAQVEGYDVAGKTGTVQNIVNGQYSSDSHTSLFAGVVPADDPRIVMVIMVNGASAGQYYGGLVSAPVFSKVAAEALRVLGVPPEDTRKDSKSGQLAAGRSEHSRNEG